MVGRRVFTRRRIREGRACRDRILRSDGALAVVRRGIIRYAPGDGTLSVITDTDADFGLRVSYNLCYNVRVLEAGRWSIEKFILEKCAHL